MEGLSILGGKWTELIFYPIFYYSVPVIPALRQKDHELEVTLGCITRCLKNQNQTKRFYDYNFRFIV
jgi:hypothetical protein